MQEDEMDFAPLPGIRKKHGLIIIVSRGENEATHPHHHKTEIGFEKLQKMVQSKVFLSASFENIPLSLYLPFLHYIAKSNIRGNSGEILSSEGFFIPHNHEL